MKHKAFNMLLNRLDNEGGSPFRIINFHGRPVFMRQIMTFEKDNKNAANNITFRHNKKHSISCSALDGQATVNRLNVGLKLWQTHLL